MTGSLRRSALLTAALLLPVPTGWGAVPNSKTADRDAASSPSAETVHAALQSEASGDNSTRNQLLEGALSDDGDNAAARWQLGYVRLGERWVPYAEELDASAGRRQILYAYQQARETAPDTVAGQMSLANLAREHGLSEEERAHLRRVVALDWSQEEARRRLGDVLVDGFWVTRDEITRFAGQLAATRSQRATWDPHVQPIVRRLFRSQQVAWQKNWRELAAIRDPAAIPSVEAALADYDERGTICYLDWLDGVAAWEASVALARQAVLASGADVRSLAQQRLKRRRIDEFAPALINSITSERAHETSVELTNGGAFLVSQRTQFETQYELRRFSCSILFGPESSLPNGHFARWEALADNLDDAMMAWSVAQKIFFNLRREARASDVEGERLNQRISRCLATVVGCDEPADPREWWNWWLADQNVYQVGKKSLHAARYEEFWAVDRRHIFQVPDRQSLQVASCFEAGTPVITESGPQAIEQIRTGDRVLCQDPETGEVAFKPVLQTTIRPPAPLLAITTDHGVLVCTSGHPFWINGSGWRLARELQPGMRFHSIDGASEILSVEDAGREDKAYNLVVADFHTYFVGDGKILSHDNTPRAPTNALVPGLMPDYATADIDPQVSKN